eukprot:scaffold84360_cov47-Attheya_sp.AAC.2
MGLCLGKAGVFMDPVVRVHEIKMSGVGFAGVEVDCTLEVMNPNISNLSATRIVHSLKKASDGTQLTDGVLDKNFTIPSGESIQIVVPMKFAYMGVGAVGKSLVKRGATEILVTGDITFDAPMTRSGVVVSHFQGQAEIMID